MESLWAGKEPAVVLLLRLHVLTLIVRLPSLELFSFYSCDRLNYPVDWLESLFQRDHRLVVETFPAADWL